METLVTLEKSSTPDTLDTLDRVGLRQWDTQGTRDNVDTRVTSDIVDAQASLEPPDHSSPPNTFDTFETVESPRHLQTRHCQTSRRVSALRTPPSTVDTLLMARALDTQETPETLDGEDIADTPNTLAIM